MLEYIFSPLIRVHSTNVDTLIRTISSQNIFMDLNIFHRNTAHHRKLFYNSPAPDFLRRSNCSIFDISAATFFRAELSGACSMFGSQASLGKGLFCKMLQIRQTVRQAGHWNAERNYDASQEDKLPNVSPMSGTI